MKKNWVIFCHHMLESIKLIEEYTRDKTEEDFLSSSQHRNNRGSSKEHTFRS